MSDEGLTRPKNKAEEVSLGLRNFYFKNVRSLEEQFKFDKFCTPLLNEADFLAKPMVLLIGQYSVGKTTFIRYLLERDFPGMRIGPEPTTDKFAAISYGLNERVIPGHAAAVDRKKPYQNLQTFGSDFLNRFEVSELMAPILEHITFIDSPGVLSGEKQRLNRGYNFPKVISYWASRVDRILLLFDAHKLDISDEFQEAINALKGNDDKIRCVLNKADQISQQQLMRVYGALLWSLGKILKTPEVLRVYVSSFWDKPYQEDDCRKLFDAEKLDLLTDLKLLPRSSSIRKINEFVKRTRRAKVHALIIEHLRGKFGWFGAKKTNAKILDNMREMFQEVARKHNLPKGDFPNPQKFSQILQEFPINKFPKLRSKDLEKIDSILSKAIPRLMEQLSYNDPNNIGAGGDERGVNPFASKPDDIATGGGGDGWVVTGPMKQKYDSKFFGLSRTDGKVDGGQLHGMMQQSGLSNDVLAKIWDFSDIDSDGKMDASEFALMMYLVDYVKAGKSLPDTLPIRYIPPDKRSYFA